MMNDIKVSIVCTAYNHEKYIRDTLEGFVKQKTNFKFEVLIHDDASTDRTADIIREYEKKYPELIKPVYQKENQYSKGIKISKNYLYPNAKGKYIAICEGDDYWIDECKLQKQFDVLEMHPEIDGCVHKVQKESAIDGRRKGYIEPLHKEGIISVESIIKGGGEFIGTNSIMYRSELINSEYKFTQILAIDYVTQILIALRGGIYYLNDCMSVYRVLASGSWTSRMQKNPQALDKISLKIISMLQVLDEELEFKYHETINETILERNCYIQARNGNIKNLFSNLISNRCGGFSKKEKAILILRALKNYRRKIKNGKH